jgi:hypothetical protein
MYATSSRDVRGGRQQWTRTSVDAAAPDLAATGAIAAAVASCWKTRIGSSVDSTVTVVPSPIRSVAAAAALTIAVGEDSGIDRV